MIQLRQHHHCHWMMAVTAALVAGVVMTMETEMTAATSTCSIDESTRVTSTTGVSTTVDSALQPMVYDVGNGPQTFLAYVTPPVTSWYRHTPPPAQTAVVPKHKGLAGKFINMSNKHMRLYWQAHPHSKSASLMRILPPWDATGTATFPGHHFYVSADDAPKQVLQRYTVGPYPDSVFYYDPYLVEGDDAATRKNVEEQLTPEDQALYDGWNKTRAFNALYLNFTGRAYLSNYLRAPPRHFLWPADYFGQQHWVTTRETHITRIPPPQQLQPITSQGRSRSLATDQPRLLADYRDSGNSGNDGVLNLTLTVLSCAPRVFMIENFLSKMEVAHLLNIAAGIELKESMTGDNKFGEDPVIEVDEDDDDTRKTRTSFNSWIERERSPIVDAIYRRAADVLRLDEALLRARPDGERPDMPTNNTIAEHLQLVHYDKTQEYTAHHDFGFNEIAYTAQPNRFATLLLYLNEGMVGGQTSFPRWINAESFDELKVTPKTGNAVLFYSILPDGNFDDFSQHAALPVIKGEKWLTNLWVWDPFYENNAGN